MNAVQPGAPVVVDITLFSAQAHDPTIPKHFYRIEFGPVTWDEGKFTIQMSQLSNEQLRTGQIASRVLTVPDLILANKANGWFGDARRETWEPITLTVPRSAISEERARRG